MPKLSEDEIICDCGNTVCGDGFQACNENGEEIEPTKESGWSGLCVCGNCGSILHSDTGYYFKRNPSIPIPLDTNILLDYMCLEMHQQNKIGADMSQPQSIRYSAYEEANRIQYAINLVKKIANANVNIGEER